MAGVNFTQIVQTAGESALAEVFQPEAVRSMVAFIDALLPPEQRGQLDWQSITGVQLETIVNSGPEDLQRFIANRDFVMTPSQAMATGMPEGVPEVVLANMDPKGKTFRPTIALLMSLLLIGNIIGYCWILWSVCMDPAMPRVPQWGELVIPIGVPFLIVVTYFGFIRKERGDIINALVQHIPASGAIVKLAEQIIVAKTPAK